MKIKKKIKIIVDILMVTGMFCALNYQIWSGSAHKRISAMLYLLFILHNILNHRWYQTLFRGQYKPMRIIQTVINIGVMISMIAVMYSGILLSKEIRAELVTEGISFARGLHIASSYLGAFGMAIHLGLHIKGIRVSLQKQMKNIKKSD